MEPETAKAAFEIFNPATWPVPRIDWFFDGVRLYYSRFTQANPEAAPLVVYAGYFVLSWAAKRFPWVKSNKIPELIVGIFTGKWIDWMRERRAERQAALERLKEQA